MNAVWASERSNKFYDILPLQMQNKWTLVHYCKTKSNANHVTGHGNIKACKMLRIPHCLENRHADGDEVVSLMHWPRYTPQKHFYFCLWYSSCQRLSKPQGLVRLNELGKWIKIIHLTGSRTHDLSTCSIVLQTTTLLCKIRGFHGGDYEEWCFWDVTPCGSCKNRRFGGT
jgi:hypothetical protein